MAAPSGTPERARALSAGPFRAVIGASLFIMIGFGLIVPALPLFARRFGVGEAGVGLVLTVFSATRLIGDFVTGPLIDRHGERPITAIGAVIVGVSSIAAGAAPTFPLLVGLRGAGGIGSAFFLGGLMAFLIGTVSPAERGRAMSIFQTAVGIGFLVGPLIGGAMLAKWTPNVPLYVYGVVCFLCAPLCARAMRSAHVPATALTDAPAIGEGVPAPAPRAWHRLKPLLRHPSYRAALAVTALGFLSTGALQTLIPIYWKDVLGQPSGRTGIPFAVLALASLLVMWHAGSLSDRRGRKYALVPAVAVTGLALVGLGFAASAVAVIAFMAVFGFASGYARPGPTAMIADVAPPDARGVAVSGYRIAGDLGALIGPIMAGALAQYISYRMAFLSLAMTAALAFWVALFARETAPSRAMRAGR